MFILSKESVSTGLGKMEIFFLVDSLHGIKEFLKRSGKFTVNVALVHDGKTVASVVLLLAL